MTFALQVNVTRGKIRETRVYYFNVERRALLYPFEQSSRIAISNAGGISLAHAPLQNVYSIIWPTAVEGRNLSLSLWDENESLPVNETSPGVGRNRVSRNACKMPKQDSGTVVAYVSEGCSLFLSPFFPFYDFRSLLGWQREWS